MPLFRDIEFFTSATQLSELPPESTSEIAFAGRSNAGKSSALNALANRKRLAFVSKAPGRTQHINFFRLGGTRYLVDLPGYGYARVAKSMREHWEQLLEGYLQGRSALRGLVLVMDIRQPLTELDRTMLEWFGPTGKPVHLLLTKADKLTVRHAATTLREVEQALRQDYPQCSAQTFSSHSKIGLALLERTVGNWLGDSGHGERTNKKPPVKGE
jgi:GTP-binding protein